MKHDWKGLKIKADDVNGPAEYDVICENCGASQTDDNEDDECEATEDTDGTGCTA